MTEIYLIKISSIFVFVLISILSNGISQSPPNVFKAPPFFKAYSKVSFVTSFFFPSQSYTYTAPEILMNIHKCNIVLTDFGKSPFDQMSFDANVIFSGPNTDSFTIAVSSDTSSLTSFSFTLIVIMTQSQPFVDIDNNCFIQPNPTTPYVSSTSSTVTSFALSTLTIFPNTVGVHALSYISSFKSTVNPTFGNSLPNYIQIQLVILNSTHVQYNFTGGNNTRLTKMCIVAVFYDPGLIDTKFTNGQWYGYFQSSLILVAGNTSFQFTVPLFGPNFNTKCIVGINRIIDYKDDLLILGQNMSSFNHYNGYFSTGNSRNQIQIQMMCLGYEYQCPQAQSFYDVYLDGCFAQSNCPVSPSVSDISKSVCGLCTDSSCSSCDVNNRTLCFSCYNNTKKIILDNFCVCINQYVDPTNGSQICHINCSYYLTGCLLYGCNVTTSCSSCDYNAGYFLNSSNYCELCSSQISHCQKCPNGGICDLCSSGYYPSGGTCQSCSSFVSGCITCSNISSFVCSSCQTNYYLNNNGDECILCSLSILNCQSCTNDSFCEQCISPFINDLNNTCNNCSVGTYVTQTCTTTSNCANSRIINGIATCIGCDTNQNFQLNLVTRKCECILGFKYNIATDSCLEICGDGIVIILPCDDGNVVSGDGCSSTCQIQSGYDCVLTANQQSQCLLNQNFSITLNYITRVLGQNSALLSFTVSPASTRLETVDWRSIVTFNFSNIAGITYQYHNGQLLVKVDYTSSINGNNIQMDINFDPNQILSRPSQLQFSMFANNGNLNYQANIQDYRNFTILSWVIAVITLFQFVIATYYHKMIGLQTIQCIQTMYFIRIIITDQNNSSIFGLNGLKYSNGFNDITQKNDVLIFKQVPAVFSKLQLSLNFLDNVNIMLVPIIIAGLVYLVYKVRILYNKYKFLQTQSKIYKDVYTVLRRTAEWFYQHYFFTFTMSIFYIVIFSTILQIVSKNKISSVQNNINFLVNGLALFFIVVVVCFQILDGVKKEKEKNMKHFESADNLLDYDENKKFSFQPLYPSFYIIYYMILIMLISTSTFQFEYVIQCSLAYTMLYLIFISVWRPYELSVHNFGIIFNQLCIVFLVSSVFLTKYITLGPSSYSGIYYLILLSLFFVNGISLFRVFCQRNQQAKEVNKKKSNKQICTKTKQTDQVIKRNIQKYIGTNINKKENYEILIKNDRNLQIQEHFTRRKINQIETTNNNQQNFKSIETLDKIKQRLRKQLKEQMQDSDNDQV